MVEKPLHLTFDMIPRLLVVLVILWDLLECSNRIYVSSSSNLNFEPEIKRSNSILSRIFRWTICGYDSAIVPIEPVKLERDPFPENDLDELSSLMELDPFDLAKVSDQHGISKERRLTTNPKDLLSNLPDSLLDFIFEFLPQDDWKTMRGLNHNLLVIYICVSRSRFIKSLSPRIQSGFEILQESTLSASFLNQLELPLKMLLSNETRYKGFGSINLNVAMSSPRYLSTIEESLDVTTNLKQLINFALQFYRYKDITAFLNLLEAVSKGRIFNLRSAPYEFGIVEGDLLFLACREGHLCLVKTLLRSGFKFDTPVIYSALSVCVSAGHFKVFQRMLQFSYRKSLIGAISIVGYLEESIKTQRVDFVKFLFENYPCLSKMESRCLSLCILVKNIHIMKLILKYRSDLDFFSDCEEIQMNMLEYAAKRNFFEAIALICDYESGLKLLRKSSSSIRFAIHFESDESIAILINLVTRYGSLDSVYNIKEILPLLVNSMLSSNLQALKLILNNLTSRFLQEFDTDIDELSSCKNIIHYAITKDAKQAFDAILDHFHPSALDMTDVYGKNAFMIAVESGKFYCARKIARINPNSIHKLDIYRNNALHILLKSDHSLDLIKTFAFAFELNWEAVNSDGQTPISLFYRISRRFTIEDRFRFYDIIAYCINN